MKADLGSSIVVADTGSPAARALLEIAERFHQLAGTRAMALPVLNQ